MKLIKNHLSLIISISAILFGLEFYIAVDDTIAQYEKKLLNDYEILIVSQNEFDKESIGVEQVKAVREVNLEESFKKFDTSLIDESFADNLPHFYALQLRTFPDEKRLAQIESALLNRAGVLRVETFKKTHDMVFDQLLLIKKNSIIFASIIFIISFLLIVKQMKIWQFEHNERMYIMELFGAPLLLRSGILIKIAVVDSIISSFVVSILFLYISASNSVQSFFTKIGLEGYHFSVLSDFFLLLFIALCIALFSTIIVISKRIENND